MPRLLTCQSCGTMYRMKDYEGPAEYDMELIELCQRHLGQASNPDPDAHKSMIFANVTLQDEEFNLYKKLFIK